MEIGGGDLLLTGEEPGVVVPLFAAPRRPGGVERSGS